MAGEEGPTDGRRPAVRLGGDGRRRHGRKLGPPVARKRIRCQGAMPARRCHGKGRGWAAADGGWGRAATDIDGEAWSPKVGMEIGAALEESRVGWSRGEDGSRERDKCCEEIRIRDQFL